MRLLDYVALSGYEGAGPHISMQASANPPVFSRARAAAHYAGTIRRLIVRYKFEDRHEALSLFVKLMREAGRELLKDAHLLVPVPLHRLRLLQRRFNQSALLAKRFGRVTGVRADVTALKRIRRTSAQVGLSYEARQKNVAEAFRINRNAAGAIKGRSIVLVDDVMTTGATANACAAALIEAGAERVDVLAIALVAQGPANFDGEESY